MSSGRNKSENNNKKKNKTPSFFGTCDSGQCSANSASLTSSSPQIGAAMNGAVASFTVTMTHEILTDLLEWQKYNSESLISTEDLINALNQFARLGILWGCFDANPYLTAFTPLFQSFIYQITRDDRRYQGIETDPNAETIARVVTVASMLGINILYDINYNETPLSEATLTSITNAASSIITSIATQRAYQWIKSSLFSSNDTRTVDEPKIRTGMSVGM